MVQGIRIPRRVLVAGCLLALFGAMAVAQQGAVAAMFGSDQKRDQSLGPSFTSLNLAPTRAAAFPATVYLGAGDLERAFDTPKFRLDAAIVPTNTDLQQPG